MRPVEDPQVPDFVSSLQRFSTFSEVEEIKKSTDFAVAGAEERTIFLEDTVIMTEGHRHTELKQMFAPLLSREAIAYYELHLIEPVIQSVLAEKMGTPGPDGLVHLDIVPMIHAALTRIAAAVVGVDGVDTPERTERFKALVLTLSTATTGSFSRADPRDLIQAGRNALATLVSDYLQVSLDRRISLAAEVRAGRLTPADLPRDVLMTMCLAGDLSRPDDAIKIPYVWRMCALFLTGSIKTTSHSLPHLFVHIDEWLREHPEDAANLTNVDWLHRAAAESFRLHQVSPVRFRQAVRDVTLSNGRSVAAGEMVALMIGPANLQAEVWGEDTRLFNMNRTIPKGLRPWGLTFGAGPHTCMGQNLVTGMMNKGDDKHGTHGTAVRVAKALYSRGARLDPQNPPRRPAASLHDTWESVPMVLRP